jgi:ATP-dependent DNA ligase
MKLFKDKFTKTAGGILEGDANAVDEASALKAQDYKKSVIKSYLAIPPEQTDRVGTAAGSEFYVTRKYDGELNIIFLEDSECALINRSGRVKLNIPCLDEAEKLLKAAGIKQAIIPAELYMDEENGRMRVFDVLKAYADKSMVPNLRLAPFDILELDGNPLRVNSYGDIHAKLTEIFGEGVCKPVRCVKAVSVNEVKDIYSKWVEEEGAEGLVLRTASHLVYKIKPRHTIDVAVVGFSEGTGDAKGQMRSLLIALMGEEGKYQIIGRTGGGFSDELRKEFLVKLSGMVIPSKYIETDSNHVAFRMVRPEMVIEILVNDVIFESTSGPVLNTIVDVRNGEYHRHSSCEGLSVVSPIFVRVREDKKVCLEDVRLEQVSAFTVLPTQREGINREIPASTLLHREVYKKESGGKLMVQKYMVWKTNKEHLPEYPAYVLHYTNYSSDRKERLQREIRVSSDKEQILEMIKKMLAENVKKGWSEVN